MTEGDQQSRARSTTASAPGFEPGDRGSIPRGPSIYIQAFTVFLLGVWFLTWSAIKVEERAHREAELVEFDRINNMLELQYFEMEWSDEAFDAWCEEHPEDCQTTY